MLNCFYLSKNPSKLISLFQLNTLFKKAFAFESIDIILGPKVNLRTHWNGDIVISVLEKKDDTSSTYDLVLGENTSPGNFCMYFKEEYLKILKGTYDVSISSQSISYFVHKDLPLEYWIALEPDSYYEVQ